MAHPADEPTAPLYQAEAAVRQWRAAHPQATFAEIEAVLDQELRAARAQLLASVTTPPGETPAPRCPQCGTPMQWRGTHTRTLRTDGDAAVPLDRSYAACPTCGHGLFPPGPDA
jgi:hypothetical protein